MPIFSGTPRFVIPNGILSQVNDVMPGGTQNSVSGIQVARDPGQLGGYYYLTGAEAAARFGNLSQPLFSGLYQYVQLSASSTGIAAGAWVYFTDATSAAHGAENYVVTTVSAATVANAGMYAGVIINGNWTAGNYGWIQVGGILTVKYKATIAGSGVVGDVVTLDIASPSNLFDDPATQGTAATIALTTVKAIVGTALTAPSNGGTGQVLSRISPWSF